MVGRKRTDGFHTEDESSCGPSTQAEIGSLQRRLEAEEVEVEKEDDVVVVGPLPVA